MIYLDYNATTPVCAAAIEAMEPYVTSYYGNPSSIHAAGRRTRAAIDESRDQFAAILKGKPHEIVFTSGGTESDNLAVIGLARARREFGKHVITCQTEHHAVLHAFDFLERREGFRVTRLGVDSSGMLSLDELADSITSETTLVSIMSANNETGVLHPTDKIGALCREKGVLYHTDAIQSFGKEPVETTYADAVSLASHKFYGPKGAGVLWLRSGLAIDRLQVGGSHENERRAGTENVAAIVGAAAAARAVLGDREIERERQQTLRDALWNGIRSAFPGAIYNGLNAPRLANTLNVSFPGLDSETLLMNLDIEGVCASSGSACMVGSVQPSHVLLAMGVHSDLARSALRFSLGKQTASDEIDKTVKLLPRIFDRMQSV